MLYPDGGGGSTGTPSYFFSMAFVHSPTLAA